MSNAALIDGKKTSYPRNRRSKKRSPAETKPAEMSGCKWIPLTQGKWALVDGDDFERVSEFLWFYVRDRHTGYARRTISTKGRGGSHSTRPISMHRFLAGESADGMVIDHINGDGLDNRHANRRAVTPRENSANRTRVRSDSRTGVLGVHKRENGTFRAIITRGGKQTHLGIFRSIEAAVAARQAAEQVQK